MNNKSLDTSVINKIDKDNMLNLLITFPMQCEEALEIARSVVIPSKYKRKYKNVVFMGLGGSAIGADLIRSYVVDECKIPITVVRDYVVPAFVGEGSLVIAGSYSGNTEETLSMYEMAKKEKADVVVISSGGKISEKALSNKDLVISIPGGFPPRCALGYSFIPPLVLLSKLKIIKNKMSEIEDAISDLRKLGRYELNSEKSINQAKKIALMVYGKFPVIYAANWHMDVVAVRWRGQLAENSKSLASHHVYPEMNHNEIVGWCQPKDIIKGFIILNLRDKDEHKRVKTRIKVTASILKKAKFQVVDIESHGTNLLSRMLSLIHIGDFVSLYLAVLYGINPTPVERISYLKSELAKVNE